MKTIKIVLLLTIITFSFITTNANALATKGDRSCGDWVISKEQSNKGEYVINLTWFTGYMSGLAAGMNADVLQGVDGNSIMVWVDNYCKANPLQYLSSAGIDLFLELKNKKN